MIDRKGIDDGYIPDYLYGIRRSIGMDNGMRSEDTSVHRQSTLSRIDEVKFRDIIDNKEYYERVDCRNEEFEDKRGMRRFYNVCFRCGYIPMSKLDMNNTKYIDQHCKCGNPVTFADFSEDEIYVIKDDYEYSDRMRIEMEREWDEAFSRRELRDDIYRDVDIDHDEVKR